MVLKDSYYNVLLTRYGNEDGKVVEARFMVSVSALGDWLTFADLSCCEVTIRDVETLSFDVPSSFTPRWFKFGD